MWAISLLNKKLICAPMQFKQINYSSFRGFLAIYLWSADTFILKEELGIEKSSDPWSFLFIIPKICPWNDLMDTSFNYPDWEGTVAP